MKIEEYKKADSIFRTPGSAPARLSHSALRNLSDREVHVWQADLDVSSTELERFLNLLDGAERDRAARYHRPEDRRRFIAAHGLLRTILGHYLSADPAGLQFVAGRWGKPALARGNGSAVAPLPVAVPCDLRFSMSHSQALALYALACGREVGVDLERVPPDFDWEPIARHFFSAQERAALSALPPEARLSAFFNIWTCKEACVKATGEGFSHPSVSKELDHFEIPGRLWTLRRLDLGPGWAAAVAAEGQDFALEFRRWPPG